MKRSINVTHWDNPTLDKKVCLFWFFYFILQYLLYSLTLSQKTILCFHLAGGKKYFKHFLTQKLQMENLSRC